MKSSALEKPTLDTLGLDLNGLVCVHQRVLVFRLRSVYGGAFGVEEVVAWVEIDGLGEFDADQVGQPTWFSRTG